MIRSSLAKHMPVKEMNQIYSKIDQIQVYTMINLSDTFPIIGQCRRVRELTLLTANESIISKPQTTSSGSFNKIIANLKDNRLILSFFSS
jgi:hypothetical protein